MRNIVIDNIHDIIENNFQSYDYQDFCIKAKKLQPKDKFNLINKEIIKYSDFYNDFILSLIDQSDFIIFSGFSNDFLEFYKNVLNYYECTIINFDKNAHHLKKVELLFNIKKKKDKKIIKDNLKYNLEEYESWLSDCNVRIRIIDTNRDYIANDQSYEHKEYMYFIKENKIIAGFRRRDGVIEDYCHCAEKYLNHKFKFKF